MAIGPYDQLFFTAFILENSSGPGWKHQFWTSLIKGRALKISLRLYFSKIFVFGKEQFYLWQLWRVVFGTNGVTIRLRVRWLKAKRRKNEFIKYSPEVSRSTHVVPSTSPLILGFPISFRIDLFIWQKFNISLNIISVTSWQRPILLFKWKPSRRYQKQQSNHPIKFYRLWAK